MTEETVPAERRQPLGFVRRAAQFAPHSFNDANRSIDLVFTAGGDVDRRDWWTNERWVESLEVSADAVDLSRLNAGAPLLNTHGAYDLEQVIGVVERAWIEGGKGLATVRFSERADVAPIVADVRAGILRNISVGYQVSEWREEDRGGVKRRTATRWQPMEISFVPIPADAAAQVRSAPGSEPALPQATPAAPQESRMTEQVTTAPAQPDADAIRAEATKAERARVAEIREAAKLAGLDQAWIDAQVAADATGDAARRAALAELGRKQAPATGAAVVQVISDEGDVRMRGVEAAMTVRLSGGKAKWEGDALQFRGATYIDMARACIEVRGTKTSGWSRDEIAQIALGLPVMGRNMQTTSDFVALLANVQSKRLISSYEAFDRSFLAWCHRRTLPDFKAASTVELGGAPTLLALAEGGQINLGVMQDSGETVQLVRYARNVALSYPAIVNDDLGGFDRLPMAFAVSAANLENALVYGILSTNANMSDSNALFSTAHGNTSAQAATVDGISAVRALMRRQTDASGQQILISPSIIIAPVELEATLLALFSPDVTPSGLTTTSVNPWRGTFDVIATPFLTDTNDYYVTVQAGTGYEAVEAVYQEGAEAPQLTSYVQPRVDGVEFSLRHSFGAKAVTWRTIARATA